MLDLIPNFGNVLYTIGAFLIAFGVVAAVHEYGHYLVGRFCGIKAEVFSLGIGPELWSREDRHGTVWRVAALPLGGYVRFAGDDDIASSSSTLAKAGVDPSSLSHTLDGAPLWARAATVSAGPLFNFACSILVFAALFAYRGVVLDPLTVEEVNPGFETALLPGDEIIAIDGLDYPGADELYTLVAKLPPVPEIDYTVRRDGRYQTVSAPNPFPAIIAGVVPDSAAADSGLQVDDVIRSLDEEEIWSFEQMRKLVESSDGSPLALEVWRDGTIREVSLTPRRTDYPLADGTFESRYLIGISAGSLFIPKTESIALGSAVGYGASETLHIIRLSLSGLYHIAAGLISSCNLRGPIGIAQTSGAAASQGWFSFIHFIAVLSAAIGLINLFPIPVLDGGHLVFHAWEAVTRKRPNERIKKVLTMVGLALILALMSFAILNDIRC